MLAGNLDRRVTLLRRTLSRNVHGEEVEEFDTLDTVWAQKLDLTAREFFSAQRELAEGTARFLLRYRSDLSVTDRITYGGYTYDITQIAELGRKEGLDIVAVMREA